MWRQNIALFWKWYVLLAGEDGLPGTGVGNPGKLVKFSGGNWKVVIEYCLLSKPFHALWHYQVMVMNLSQLQTAFF